MGKEVLFKGVETVAEYRSEFKQAFREFLDINNIKKVIAICGGADGNHSENIVSVLREFVSSLQGYKFAILTGGTKGGIPEIGLQVAKETNIPTIGVFPGKARKSALFEKLDLAIETYPPTYGDPDWGTETSSFVQLANGIIVIGGGMGTLTEVSSALKISASRIRKAETPIYICPITGTGGVTDIVYLLPDIQKSLLSLPANPVFTGVEAAEFIKHVLFNNDDTSSEVLPNSPNTFTI